MPGYLCRSEEGVFFWLEANVGHHNIPVPSGTGPWFARHSPTSDGVPDMRGVNSRNPVPYTVLAFKLHSCVKLSTTCEINGKAVTAPILTHTAVLPCRL